MCWNYKFPWSKSPRNLSEYEICFVLNNLLENPFWTLESPSLSLWNAHKPSLERLILNIDVNLICISLMESTFFCHTLIFILTQVIIWYFEMSHVFISCSTFLPCYRTWFKNWWFAMIKKNVGVSLLSSTTSYWPQLWLTDIRFLLWNISPNYDIFPKRKLVYFIMIHFKKLFWSFNVNCNALGCK